MLAIRLRLQYLQIWVNSSLLEVPNILRFLHLPRSDLLYPLVRLLELSKKVPGWYFQGAFYWLHEVNLSSLKLLGHTADYSGLSQTLHSSKAWVKNKTQCFSFQ